MSTGAYIYLAGEEDITQKFIDENKIDTIISVNPELKCDFKRVTRLHYPFNDAPPSAQLKGYKDNAAKAVAALVDEVRVGHSVIVHCHAGVHRSPAVVYVAMVKLGWFENTYDAYEHVRNFRPMVQFYKKLVKWVQMAAE